MKLFLASEGKHHETLKQLKDFVGGLQHKTIAYIPTAANGEKWGSWKDTGTWEILQQAGANVSFVQLEDCGDQDVISQMLGRDIVWFAGGMAGYLLYWVRRTQLDKALQDILRHSVFVGSSAGSMIAGQTLDIAQWYPGDQEIGASIFPGLALVDFDIYPHYEESMLPTIKEHYKGKKLYLLKNGEHITFEDGNITVFGKERVITQR